MRTTLTAAAVALTLLPALALAQEPVPAFDRLNTRLKIGDQVVVTDTQGRRRAGSLVGLSPSSLTLDGKPGRTFPASDVRLIEERRPDSLKNGALIGLASGFAVGAGLAASICSQDGCEGAGIAAGVALYAGIGAAIGAGIDALIPGKKLVVYQAADGRTSARLMLAPVVTPHTTGVAFSLSF